MRCGVISERGIPFGGLSNQIREKMPSRKFIHSLTTYQRSLETNVTISSNATKEIFLFEYKMGSLEWNAQQNMVMITNESERKQRFSEDLFSGCVYRYLFAWQFTCLTILLSIIKTAIYYFLEMIVCLVVSSSRWQDLSYCLNLGQIHTINVSKLYK